MASLRLDLHTEMIVGISSKTMVEAVVVALVVVDT
jgi:hypothetical protein